MSETIRWSHEGWYWFCPILWSDDQEVAAEKHWSLYPLFKLSCWFDRARIFVTTLIDPDYEPTFMFKLRPIPRHRTPAPAQVLHGSVAQKSKVGDE